MSFIHSRLPRKQGSILYCTTGIILQWLQSDPWVCFNAGHLVKHHQKMSLLHWILLLCKSKMVLFLIFHWFDKMQSLKSLKIICDPWNTTEPSQLLRGPAAPVSPRSCYEGRGYQDQNPNQNLHFNLIPRWFTHIGKFKKLSFRITKTRV